MQFLSGAGIDYEVVPGVSSLFAAAAALKTQLTLGGVAETLIVTRPAGSTLEQDEIQELSEHKATLVFFLGTAHLEEITSRVRCPPETLQRSCTTRAGRTRSSSGGRSQTSQRGRGRPVSRGLPSSS